MKNANPEIPIAKATGIPSTKKTRNIIIAVDIIIYSPILIKESLLILLDL